LVFLFIKPSRRIVNENQVIAVENLNVKGMMQNHCLAKAIQQLGWGQFCTMLKYKAELIARYKGIF
jgi:putative transposase